MQDRKRILIGGFQHETNTFKPELTQLSDFEEADYWPGLVQGNEIFQQVKGINLPVTFFLAFGSLQYA